jgi:hypothetical protein
MSKNRFQNSALFLKRKKLYFGAFEPYSADQEDRRQAFRFGLWPIFILVANQGVSI